MNNKWWEYYAVRYFVGTVAGTGVVAYLATQTALGLELSSLLGDAGARPQVLNATLLAALGFAYCYVASVPMLVMHTARAHVRLRALAHDWRRHLVTTPIATAVIAWAASGQLSPAAAATVAVLLGVQFGLVVLILLDRFHTVENIYRNLTKARARNYVRAAEPEEHTDEYVTSYRHLREHGNAVSILILEGLLAWLLSEVSSPFSALTLVGVWLLPGPAAWLVGTALESRLASCAADELTK